MTMPPAGWYPSPEDPATKKYWDGSQWLDIPAPDVQPAKNRKRLSKRSILILSIVGAIVVLGTAGGLVWKGIADQKEEERLALIEERAQEREAERAEAAEKAAEEEAAAQEKVDDALRAMRQDSVTDIEESVKAMAEGHVADGVLTGPILSVSCSPIGGGSTDDLDQSTTVFKCFAANVDNGDGTMNGYTYNSTMNWETGEYTYGLGAP
ncbi:DUF2510 domain-containing protein [Leucobacter chromiiresistens]|uniref:DUF2510 domain-containing protein n=1 Tax=Leucobacter chromiiresistens TaxID=1079994 RepID=A0A1H1BMF3_9MICO|nr:DUF2510 domain-containing protein [Leucobacter chromiiresistens]SDQ53122.1 Protein of unknown function [Leucobacter chromiiresistens]